MTTGAPLPKRLGGLVRTTDGEAAGLGLATEATAKPEERMHHTLAAQAGMTPAFSHGAELTTRASGDMSLALVHVWAKTIDWLGFYQARIQEESFLHTCRRGENIKRLAATIGHRPDPGAAAEGQISVLFEGEGEVSIPAGMRVKSKTIPGHETTVVYETEAPLKGRSQWNAINVETTAPVTIRQPNEQAATFSFSGLRPRVGNLVLFAARPLAERHATDLERQTGRSPAERDDAARMYRVRVLTSARRAESHIGWEVQWDEGLPRALLDASGGRPYAYQLLGPIPLAAAGAAPTSVAPISDREALQTELALMSQQTAGGAGHEPPAATAIGPKPATVPRVEQVDDGSAVRLVLGDQGTRLLNGAQIMFCTNDAEKTTGASWEPQALGHVVREALAVPHEPSTVTAIVELGSVRAARDLAMTAAGSEPRFSVAAFVVGESYSWGRRPVGALPAGTKRFECGEPLEPLPMGREVLVVGRGVDGEPFEQTARVARSDRRWGAVGPTGLSITLDVGLRTAADPASVRVYGNVVTASHGETVASEVLGSGDAASTFQSFRLAKGPLTWKGPSASRPAPSPALTVRVSGVPWSYVPDLSRAGPDDRVFEVIARDDEHVEVRFGDGRTGARLPTGQNNVRATYRHGLGAVGSLPAGVLTSPLDRPLGLKGVTNPVKTGGGKDKESTAQTKRRAPARLRTLGRVVSVRDAAEVAMEHPAVAWARAMKAAPSDQMRTTVFCAGAEGRTLTSLQRSGVCDLLYARGAPPGSITVEEATSTAIRLDVVISLDAEVEGRSVVAGVRSALETLLGFPGFRPGTSIQVGKLYAAGTEVPGVRWLQIAAFGRAPRRDVGEGVPIGVAQAIHLDPSEVPLPDVRITVEGARDEEVGGLE